MASDPTNPFGLPGMSPLGAAGQANPLLASLEMMRGVMSSLGQSASVASGTMAQSLNPDDLERRITELKAVENWLKLNLSMLGSSIQGMEVQLATIKTLRSFVEMGAQHPASGDGQQPSALEVVLGIKKPATSHSTPSARAATTTPDRSAEPVVPPSPQPPPETASSAASATSGSASVTPDSTQAAAQAWWDMLQNQFSHLAAATSQATQFAQPGSVAAAKQPSAERQTKATAAASKSPGVRRPRKSTAAKSARSPKNR